MLRARMILALTVLAGALLADDKPAKCDCCGGKREVTCFACDGKGVKSACSTCGGAGKAKCLACGGAGQFVCPSCGGAGRIGDHQLRCKLCNTQGRIACKQCQGGTVPCPECGGKPGALTCVACNNRGVLPCPACAPPSNPCDRCKGKSEVPCPLCGATGSVKMLCPSCGSRRGSHCDACHGTGKIRCNGCGGSGMVNMAGRGPAGAFTPCGGCNGEGWLPCKPCGGKGIVPCATCTGLHAIDEGACPVCQGRKVVHCPRCVITSGWSGVETKSGATVTVLPCREFEPMIAAWLKTHFGVDRTAWRVVFDARGATGAFTFGGAGGCLVEASAGAAGDPLRHLHPLSDKGLDDRFGDWLSQHGYRDFHARDSVVVEKGSVRTLICLGTLEKPTEMRLTFEKDATPLKARNIGFEDWERTGLDAGGGK